MSVYYNYNNVKILVNNQSILADSLDFSLNTELGETELFDRKGDFNFLPVGGMTSSVGLTYYLEDIDPLASFLNSESSIPFEMAGLTLATGYLNQYSITANPHGLVAVSADLEFYENFGGTFAPTTLAEKDYKYKQFSDMKLTVEGIDITSKITSLNYNVSNNVEPFYDAESLTPTRIRFGKKITSLSLTTYNFLESLTYQGKEVTVDFSVGESKYNVKGTLVSKDLSVQVGQKLISNLEISSNSYGGAPVLRAANTSAPSVGGDYHVYGDNLLETTAIYFNNNIKVNEFTTHSYDGNVGGDSEIKMKVPRFAKPGPITVITPYGEAIVDTTANHVAAGPLAINSQIFIP